MDSKTEMSKEEIEIFQNFKHEIDERVGEQLIHQTNSGITKINQAALEKKCTDEFFHELTDQIAAEGENVKAFLAQLQKDDANLFETVCNQMIGSPEEAANIKTFHDMMEYGKNHKMTEAILDKVYEHGVRYYQEKAYEIAFLYFNWLSLNDDTNAQHWFLKGFSLQSLNKYNEALISYRKVISLDPTFLKAYIQAMNCLIVKGDLETTRSIYDELTLQVGKDVLEEDKSIKENLALIKEILT